MSTHTSNSSTHADKWYLLMSSFTRVGITCYKMSLIEAPKLLSIKQNRKKEKSCRGWTDNFSTNCNFVGNTLQRHTISLDLCSEAHIEEKSLKRTLLTFELLFDCCT